jgi:hypothetical protein
MLSTAANAAIWPPQSPTNTPQPSPVNRHLSNRPCNRGATFAPFAFFALAFHPRQHQQNPRPHQRSPPPELTPDPSHLSHKPPGLHRSCALFYPRTPGRLGSATPARSAQEPGRKPTKPRHSPAAPEPQALPPKNHKQQHYILWVFHLTGPSHRATFKFCPHPIG